MRKASTLTLLRNEKGRGRNMELSYLEKKVVTNDELCWAIDYVSVEMARAEKRIKSDPKHSGEDQETALYYMRKALSIALAAMRKIQFSMEEAEARTRESEAQGQ